MSASKAQPNPRALIAVACAACGARGLCTAAVVTLARLPARALGGRGDLRADYGANLGLARDRPIPLGRKLARPVIVQRASLAQSQHLLPPSFR